MCFQIKLIAFLIIIICNKNADFFFLNKHFAFVKTLVIANNFKFFDHRHSGLILNRILASAEDSSNNLFPTLFPAISSADFRCCFFDVVDPSKFWSANIPFPRCNTCERPGCWIVSVHSHDLSTPFKVLNFFLN